MSRHVVAPTSEIAPGDRKLFTVKGRPIAIFNLDGQFYGMLNRCPHQGGSLCDGIITGLVQSSTPGDGSSKLVAITGKIEYHKPLFFE